MLANVPAAEKRARQNLKRRAHNISIRSSIKTAIRRFEAAITAGDLETAKTALHRVTILLDKAASKGIIHKNLAARKKSRLTKKFASATKAS